MNRFYCILLLLFISLTGFSQSNKKETSLERLEDSTTNVTRYDLVNYQNIADQKYFKNNPESVQQLSLTALDDKIENSKSAEQVADGSKSYAQEIPLDQRTNNAFDNQIALDTKLKVSAEEKTSSEGLDVYKESKANTLPKTVEVTTVKEELEVKKEKHFEGTSSPEANTVVSPENSTVANVKESIIVSQPITTDSLKTISSSDNTHVSVPAKPQTYPSTIDFKDNNSVVPSEKSIPVVKTDPPKSEVITTVPTPITVDPSPVVIEPSPISVPKENVNPLPKPEINREQQVIDGLINSGNYDVYDDGKYIKISRKKKNK